MPKKSDNIKKHILMKISNKRFKRRCKFKLKKIIERGGKPSRKIRKKYHIKLTDYHSIRNKFKNKTLKTIEISIPEEFCFFKDPIGTNKFFKDLRKTLSKKSQCI